MKQRVGGLDVLEPVEGDALGRVQLHPGRLHARQAVAVVGGALRVGRVDRHHDPVAVVGQHHRRLGHAHVGLEADQHDGSASRRLQRHQRRRAAGQRERRLGHNRRALGQARLDARVGLPLPLRCLLGGERGHVEQCRDPREPRDPLDGVRRCRAVVVAHRGVGDEARLGVHHDEDAVSAPDQGHPRTLRRSLLRYGPRSCASPSTPRRLTSPRASLSRPWRAAPAPSGCGSSRPTRRPASTSPWPSRRARTAAAS